MLLTGDGGWLLSLGRASLTHNKNHTHSYERTVIHVKQTDTRAYTQNTQTQHL